MQLKVLYQDEHLVAVDKPSGLMVHRSWLSAKDEVFVMTLLRDQLGCHVFPLHRLDRQTCGVLLFALSSEAARAFNSLFAEKSAKKSYLAICRGYLQESIWVDHPLKEELDKIADKHSHEREAVEAQTQFHPIATAELPIAVSKYPSARYSLVEAQPKTGRKHQIRKHLNHLRHPLVVDAKHGDRWHNQMLRREFNVHRLLLRAICIEFEHPYLNKDIRISAGLNSDWEGILNIFGSANLYDDIEAKYR